MTTPITTIPELEALKQEVATLAADLRKATDSQFTRSLMIGRVKVIEALIPDDIPAPTVKPGRETLARAMYDDDGHHAADTWGTDHSGVKNHYYAHADAVLAILPGRSEADVRAETWDEGYHDGQRQGGEGDDGPRYVNPYRADEEAGK